MAEEIIEAKKDTEESGERDESRIVVFEEALEAILFAAGHPITYATLARVFEMTPAKIKDKVVEYSVIYNNPQIPRGVILLAYNDSCQLCTRQEYLHEIRDALGIRKTGTLSTSSMEVLAIVAYNQPVTRAFVDTLRRVDSSYAMNNLLDRGLIASKGRLDVPGRPMLYGTTSDFLRCFGLDSLDMLPKTTDELISAFNSARMSESSSDGEEEGENGQISADIESAMPESAQAEPTDARQTASDTASDAANEEYENEPSAEDDYNDD